MGTVEDNKGEVQADGQPASAVSHQELAESSGGNVDAKIKTLDAITETATEAEENKVLRKIDWHLLPVLMLVNAIQLIDKNVSMAVFIYLQYGSITDPS